MRELRVEDALVYLDQVKMEFGDRPHIYNEFLEIMKTFKTQQIDTPGVIRRVSTLFRGNPRLVLGFNTFLPEGYRIEIDGDGPPVAVYRAPGSNAAQILQESPEPMAINLGPNAQAMGQSIQSQGNRVQQPVGPPFAAQAQNMMQDPNRMPPRGPPTQAFSAVPPNNSHNGMVIAQKDTNGRARVAHMASLETGAGPRPPPRSALEAGRIVHQQQVQSGVPPRPQEQVVQPPQHKAPLPPIPPLQQQRGGKQAADMKIATASRVQRPAPFIPVPAIRPSESHDKGSPFDQKGLAQQRPPAQINLRLAPPQPQLPNQAQSPQPQPPQQPQEIDHAINYVTTIKKRFATEPETYKKFLDILHTYQKEQRGIKEVLDDVSVLFEDHPDLLKKFTFFLPEGVQAQAKAQLDIVAKEAEIRKQKKAKEAISTVAQTMQQNIKAIQEQPHPKNFDRSAFPPSSYTTAQGRMVDRETTMIRRAQYGKVSFQPLRPIGKGTLTPAQAAAKEGRPMSIPELPKVPNTFETTYFQRVKDHLNRKELAADKPAGSRRHTPWTEFLKCLHLFGAGILTRDELLVLLKGLFMQGHAPKSGANASGSSPHPSVVHDANELMKDFEELIIRRGPYARQEASLRDKSKYGNLRTRDFDFENCESPTPSYVTYPEDYPKASFLSHSGQSADDAKVLNTTVLCVGSGFGRERKQYRPPSIEECDGLSKRQNIYEEMMFRIEDERYELCMAIERNALAFRRIAPLADEVQALREQEEMDEQPIGRLRYKLEKYTLNSIHINAIGRIYGDRGDEVLQHLVSNPLVVLPSVYQRLKQKDSEWKEVVSEYKEHWNVLQEANYLGSLNTQFYFRFRNVQMNVATSLLINQCKDVRKFIQNAERLQLDEVDLPFQPTFGNRIPDFGAVFHQPYVATDCKVTKLHNLAFDVVAHKIRTSVNLSALARERIGRIWSEFMMPWFGYPMYWVAGEARESFSGKLSPSIVKYVPGQRVQTIIGEGTILSLLPENNSAATRYRIKTGFCIAFLSPSAVFHALPNKDNPYVRRDGIMVRDDSVFNDDDSLDTDKLHKKYKLLFGTENVYLFLRIYTILCSILTNISDHWKNGAPADPAIFFYNPQRKRSDLSFPVSLDLSGICQALKNLAEKKMSIRDYNTFAHKELNDLAHQIALLPKLVGKCAEYLTRIAKEDTLLQLYDYCNCVELDPVAVRLQCLSVVPEAVYRIQFDTESSVMTYGYLPENEVLLTNPKVENDDNNREDAMEVEESSEINGGSPPVAKRAKLR